MATLTHRDVWARDYDGSGVKLWTVTETFVKNQIVTGYNLRLKSDSGITQKNVPPGSVGSVAFYRTAKDFEDRAF